MCAVCQTVVPFIPFVPTSAPFLLYRARRLHWRNAGAAASVRHTESSNVKRQRFRRPVGAVHKRALVGSVSGSYCKAALQNNSRTRTRVRRPTHTRTHRRHTKSSIETHYEAAIGQHGALAVATAIMPAVAQQSSRPSAEHGHSFRA